MWRWLRFIIITGKEESQLSARPADEVDEGGARVYGFFNENQS